MSFPQLAAGSLSRRIALSLFLVLALGIIAAFSYFYLDARGIYEAVQARSLQEQARELIDGLSEGSDQKLQIQIPLAWNAAYHQADGEYHFTIYDPRGRVVAVSPNLEGKAPLPLTDAPLRAKRWGDLHLLGPEANPALTTRLQSGHFLVVSRAASDEEALAESLIEERSEPLLVFVPFGLIALLLIVVVTRKTLYPLEAASAAAANIGPGNLENRIATERLPAEIRPLVEALNGALDRMANAYEVEKRITANAAHELRTPLTVLSLRLQRARLGGVGVDWDAVEIDIARMKRLVSQLLDLARKDAGVPRAIEEVNLSRIAREAAADVLPLAESKHRAVVVEANEPIFSKGNADDLRDMVRNLIENAVVHGQGRIEVDVRRAQDQGRECAAISVADEGQCLERVDSDGLFERFRKGALSSEGSGLGLAIVRQVARTHGGDARFLPGNRTIVEVLLPLSGS